jgi:chromosome segregation ATPase
MLTDKAKKFDANPTNFPSPSNEKKASNVLPLERHKQNTGKFKLSEMAHAAGNEAPNGNGNGTETVEIKSRMEAILARMKSRTAGVESLEPVPSEHEPSGEELERRRAAIIAIAREAEVRAREAADTFRQAETKLVQAEAKLKEETELRMLAEQRVIRIEEKSRQIEEHSRQIEEKFKQIEEESRQWLDTAQAEEARRKEVEKAKAELEIQLKQETDARMLAEELRAEAEGKVEAAGQAVADAKQATKEAEAKVLVAEEAARAAESLIYEADEIARQMEARCHAAEANLQRETELRALAEQMLKELASAGPHLDLNWDHLEAALAQAASGPVGLPADLPVLAEDGSAESREVLQQLRAQIEAEQKARVAAEQARAEAEAKSHEMETKLRKAEEKYRTTENGYKKVLRKQEEELRTMSEQVVRNNDSGAVPAATLVENDELFLELTKPNLTRAKLKLVSYGIFITLLVLALVWLGVAAFHQLS